MLALRAPDLRCSGKEDHVSESTWPRSTSLYAIGFLSARAGYFCTGRDSFRHGRLYHGPYVPADGTPKMCDELLGFFSQDLETELLYLLDTVE